MTTANDLVQETKRLLLAGQREPLNKLASTVTSSATTFSFTYDVSTLQAQAYLQIGLELVYVWSVDVGAKTATVERAQMGSTAAAHTAGDVVTVNPKFPDFAILKALNDELYDLSAPSNGLYAVRAVDLISTGARIGYDLAGATNLMDVLEVRYKSPASAIQEWPLVPSWSMSKQVDATLFPSGTTLNFHAPVMAGREMRVLYKASFAPLVALTDDVLTVTGLPTSAHDIPPMGAAMTLAGVREVKRNFTEAQGESRRAQEVPPGSVSASIRYLAGRRQNRIVSEANKIAQQNPVRFPVTARAW